MNGCEEKFSWPEPPGEGWSARKRERLASRVQRSAVANLGAHTTCKVLHEVSDVGDAGDDPFPGKVLDRGGSRRQTPRGEVITDDPIDLLGHPPIEAPHARLDMGHGNALPDRRQCPRKGGIRVTEDDRRIGSRGLEYRFECHEHPPGLLRVAAAPNPQRVVRLRQAQLGEEDRGHPVIPMLAGIDEDVLDGVPVTRAGGQRP